MWNLVEQGNALMGHDDNGRVTGLGGSYNTGKVGKGRTMQLIR